MISLYNIRIYQDRQTVNMMSSGASSRVASGTINCRDHGCMDGIVELIASTINPFKFLFGPIYHIHCFRGTISLTSHLIIVLLNAVMTKKIAS